MKGTGDGVAGTFRASQRRIVFLSDGAATAVAAAGAPTCETTCSRHIVVVVVVVVVVVYIPSFLTLTPPACERLFRKVLIDRDLRRVESRRGREVYALLVS